MTLRKASTERKVKRWSSPNGKNFAYTSSKGRVLHISIGKRTYYTFSVKWPAK